MSLLKLKKVSKIYQTGELAYKALNEVDLEIKKGEFVAIMGPSGSGKSTLMHIAGCLDVPTTGQVLLEEEDVSKLSETELAKIRSQKIGFIFQHYNLIPRTNSQDNVSLPLIYQSIPLSERRQKAFEVLKSVGLENRIHNYPNQLSGGEQQRVAIARALVTNPSLIFADEPTGNLDSKSGHEIMEIFKKLNHEGRTIVLVTHDREIAKCAKRMVRIHDGRII